MPRLLGAYTLYFGVANTVAQVSSASALNILIWERTLSACETAEVGHFGATMAVVSWLDCHTSGIN
jgi:hypothetical protein